MIGGRKRKASILLSVIVPLSLLLSFRFTGILQSPINPATYTAETITWNMTRPNEWTRLNETLTNEYNDGVLATVFRVGVGWYYENHVWGAGDCNCDSLDIRFDVVANATVGFIHSFVIRFSHVDVNASFDVHEDSHAIFLYNAKLGTIDEAWITDSGYIEAYAVNDRNTCNLTMFGQWIFYDNNNANHNITFTLEALCDNGFTYKRIIMPIEMLVQVP
jgi:hypothetical protein